MLAPPDLLPENALIDGRYRVVQYIGGGGFGTVYRARQLDVEREVALKILHPELVRSAEGRRRFEREAELARRLRHPNTVFLYDHGATADGSSCFIAYELLRGRSLADELEGTNGLAGERVARIAAQVLAALGEAHQLGIVHRDIKPSNIHLARYAGERDFVKLLDFGIAKDLSASDATKLTQTGQALGTPSYMAPEQILGRSAGPATDLYALGLVMAEMIDGRAVYQGNAIQVIAQQMSNDPVPLSRAVVEHRLAPLIARATQKDPASRYPSAAEMSAHLERIERAAQPEPRPPAPPTAGPAHLPIVHGPSYPAPPPHGSPPPAHAPVAPKGRPSSAIVGAIAGGLLLVVAAAVVVALLLRGQEEPAKPRSREIAPAPAATREPVAASAAATPARIKDLTPEQIRAAVEAEGYRVKSQRVVRDAGAGTETTEIDIEKDPVNHGIIFLTTCRSADQARKLARNNRNSFVDDNVILLVNVSAQDDAGRRIRARLIPVGTKPAVEESAPPG